MSTCPHCQAPVRDGARFCSNCGSVLAPSVAPPTGLLPPRTLLHERYLVLRKIAQGGMSAVYQAADVNQPGILWAVKEMSDAGLNPAERSRALADFQREANLLLNLRHPNLPLAIDLFEEAGKHFLVMAFVEGETLEARLDRAGGPLPVADVLGWAEQLCDLLAYLHAQRPPVIYRDLKPANAMIDATGVVQLIDFGIARFHKPGRSSDTTRVGTEGYASPEHYGQGQTEARSDLYTLGATLYHLLTGQVPPTAIERLLPPPAGVPLAPPSQLNPAIPAHVEAAILRALELRLDARYGDPGRPESALAAMKAALQGQAPTQPRTKPCPACGKPNLAASLACFACGYDFQTGRTPVAPPPSVAPLPVVGPVGTVRLTPYTLSTGHIAAAPADLPAVCDADWNRAVDHFVKGYITDWLRDGVSRLRAAHQHGPADDLEQSALRAEAIVQRVRRADANAQHAGLEEFLESLGAAAPVLEVIPKKLDLGTLGLGETGQPATLTLANRGRGYLSGTVASGAPWLKVTPDHFGCAAGGRSTAMVTPDLGSLPAGQTQLKTNLQIHSNGGQATLKAQIQVLAPRLEVTPTHVNLGTIDPTQPGAAGSADLTVCNAGGSVLTGKIAVGADWLAATPATFRCRAGEKHLAHLSTTQLRTGDYRQIVRLTSNAGTSEVSVVMQVHFGLEPEMVRIPAGEFLMGSSKQHREATSDEKPQHQVYLDEYWIGKYPITNLQYAVFVSTSGHRPPRHWIGGSPPQGKENHPVVFVSWEDAVAYCQWLAETTGRRYHLPTEAEWEKAARGVGGRVYPWGNAWDTPKCNSSEGNKKDTTSVGTYSPAGDSPYGCADMAGNVWEWCADWYSRRYYRNSPARNPLGPASGSERVLRGGSWGNYQWGSRVAIRRLGGPSFAGIRVGFRCARSGSDP